MNTLVAVVAVAGIWTFTAAWVWALDKLVRWMARRLGWAVAE